MNMVDQATVTRACVMLAFALPIKAAYRSSLDDCPSPCRCLKFEGLWSVYCNRTGITTIPRGIPTRTQFLDVSGNSIGSIQADTFSGLVNLQELGLAAIGFNKDSFAPGAFDHLPNLQSINLAQNYFTFIPPNLPSNLSYLELYGNKITYLAKESFKNYTNLAGIDLQSNGLTGIDLGTFDVLKYITDIDISFNNLADESIPPKIFSKNINLTLLKMRFNKLKTVVRDLPASLQHLDFVGNQITTIPAYVFQTLHNLQTVEFWQGQV